MSSAILTVFVVLLALSVPVAIAIGIAAVVGVKFFLNMPMLVVGQQLFTSID